MLDLNFVDLCWQGQVSGAPDILELNEGCSCFANSCLDICVCTTLLVKDAAQVDEGLVFIQGTSIQYDWILACGFYLEDLGLEKKRCSASKCLKM